MSQNSLIEAHNLKKFYSVYRGLFFSKKLGEVKAVDGVNFEVIPGETLGLVGESGCGKTTTCKLILKLETKTSGTLLFKKKDIDTFNGDDTTTFRQEVQAVFQDPYSSLNPRIRVGRIISEPLIESSDLTRTQRKDRVRYLLEQVSLPLNSERLYPHEFSGGQRQRIAIARALALNPELIVLDEPVSALDVSVRAQILNLLKDLQQEFGLTYLIIAHDLSTVRYFCNNVAVMYLGKIMENATSEKLYENPMHPYTQSLFAAAMPVSNSKWQGAILTGEVPSPFNPPSGCRFHPRCSRVMPICKETEPEYIRSDSNHYVACHLYI